MPDDLQFLVHFFNDPEYLFKTIPMARASQVDEILSQISSQKGWYWKISAQSERQDYLKRRLFVEKELYEDYTQAYGNLKEKIPAFYRQGYLCWYVELGCSFTVEVGMDPRGW